MIRYLLPGGSILTVSALVVECRDKGGALELVRTPTVEEVAAVNAASRDLPPLERAPDDSDGDNP